MKLYKSLYDQAMDVGYKTMSGEDLKLSITMMFAVVAFLVGVVLVRLSNMSTAEKLCTVSIVWMLAVFSINRTFMWKAFHKRVSEEIGQNEN